MKSQEFIDKLYAIGWQAIGDAQHFQILDLWRQLFPLHAEIEELEREIESMNEDAAGESI